MVVERLAKGGIFTPNKNITTPLARERLFYVARALYGDIPAAEHRFLLMMPESLFKAVIASAAVHQETSAMGEIRKFLALKARIDIERLDKKARGEETSIAVRETPIDESALLPEYKSKSIPKLLSLTGWELSLYKDLARVHGLDLSKYARVSLAFGLKIMHEAEKQGLYKNYTLPIRVGNQTSIYVL